MSGASLTTDSTSPIKGATLTPEPMLASPPPAPGEQPSPLFLIDGVTGSILGPVEVMRGDDDRTFWAILSGEVMDSSKEFLTVDDLYKMMDTFVKRGGPIHLGHDKGRHVGRTLSWYPASIELPSRAKVPAVVIKGEVFRDYRFDDAVWESILKGDLSMVSIGTLSYLKTEMVGSDGSSAVRRRDFEPWHVALTPGGKCPLSWIFKAGGVSFASRLQKQNIKLLDVEEIANTLRSVSIGSLGIQAAEEIAKSLKEDSTMTGEKSESTPPQPVEELTKAVEALKKDLEDMKLVFTSLFEEKDGKMVLKELVFPNMNIGVNKQSVSGEGEAVLKEQKLREIVTSAVTEAMKSIGTPKDTTPMPGAKDGVTPAEVMKANGEGAAEYDHPTMEYFTKIVKEVQ